MGGGRQGQNLVGCIGNKKLLAGNAQALASVLAIDFGSTGLEPDRIPLEAIILRRAFVNSSASVTSSMTSGTCLARIMVFSEEGVLSG